MAKSIQIIRVFGEKQQVITAEVPDEVTRPQLVELFVRVTRQPISEVGLYNDNDTAIGDLLARGKSGQLKDGDVLKLLERPPVILDFRGGRRE